MRVCPNPSGFWYYDGVTTRKKLQSDDKREPIWSVPRRVRAAYFTLFNIQSLTGIGYLTWYEVTQRTDDTVHETIFTIIEGIFPVAGASAVTSFITTEVLRSTMVLAEYLKEEILDPARERRRAKLRAKYEAEVEAEIRAEGLAEGLAEGQAKGRAEAIAEMREWNQRRMDAEAKGESFDEPLPS